MTRLLWILAVALFVAACGGGEPTDDGGGDGASRATALFAIVASQNLRRACAQQP